MVSCSARTSLVSSCSELASESSICTAERSLDPLVVFHQHERKIYRSLAFAISSTISTAELLVKEDVAASGCVDSGAAV